jgi:hypothetical protein
MVFNLTLSNRMRDGRFEWAVSARNLLDAEYRDPGAEEHLQASIPQDGRTLGVRATWCF